ncbi:hypothetical protein FHS26_000548 [Rhizobium pisi]|jgi:hypothetical protein|uniref:Uncharacterized protein n=2 Tax=Rhizobium TaxID=379 RepID=A0A7W6B6W1_9HYPH|nr:hypothetical protein [Rhizobium pisi]MBB3913709.1 hypothetical protein [Rhizobium fabae]
MAGKAGHLASITHGLSYWMLNGKYFALIMS